LEKKMSVIYVGCVAVIILAVLGFLGAAESIASQKRGRAGPNA
jgi:hypothetical protein